MRDIDRRQLTGGLVALSLGVLASPGQLKAAARARRGSRKAGIGAAGRDAS